MQVQHVFSRACSGGMGSIARTLAAGLAATGSARVRFTNACCMFNAACAGRA